MANQANSNEDQVAKGGYIVDESNGSPDLILISAGTELDNQAFRTSVQSFNGFRHKLLGMGAQALRGAGEVGVIRREQRLSRSVSW